MIKGIGEKSQDLLLKEFKTIDNIKKSDIKLLEKILKPSKAKLVYEYFLNSK